MMVIPRMSTTTMRKMGRSAGGTSSIIDAGYEQG
jgi:hypothetical protein